MTLQLFDGSDSENDDISKIKINEEYARRFEHNKRREDLQRFEELKKKGVIDSPSPSADGDQSDSESSDDDDYVKLLNSRKSDKKFFDVLLKVKKQDPVLKQKDVKLFESDHSSEDESDEEKSKSKEKDKKGKKPIYIKDVNAKHLLEEGPEFGDEEEETYEKKKGKSKFANGKKTYADEEEELKRAVLEAVKMEGLEDEGDFLTVKEKAGEDKVDSDDEELKEKLVEYFGEDEKSNFLRSYFENKMWIDKNAGKSKVGEEELQEISEDDEEIERQEEYEYRFQENPGDRVVGHARKVEGSVRKKTNTRKEQRKSKEERMEIAQKERKEELKHLKNLKKQEIQEKVKKIMKTAGINDDDIIRLSAAEIEEEFDPEEYDRMMKKAFDEKYYNTEDPDPGFCSDEDGMEKPDFEKEDELLGLPKGWDTLESDGGFLAAREKALKQKIENTSDDDDDDDDDDDNDDDGDGDGDGDDGDDEDEDEDDDGDGDDGDDDVKETENEKEKVLEEGSRKRKRKTALLEKARQAMMDEYYKLDYEDTIGDLKTRFKYAKTKPNKFGLKAAEVLLMDDKELNQYVSLKKIAPYREEEWKLNKQKKYMLKMRAKELLRTASLDKKIKKKSKVESRKFNSSKSGVKNEKEKSEESSINKDNLSRKAKRKLSTADLKLPPGRLKAYGKLPSKSKHGGKN